MSTPWPYQVTLMEVGPRDGFQFEKKDIPTNIKAEVVAELVEAGLTHIQVVSFVHPGRVPQMADAEDLLNRLSARPGLSYNGLVLNERGLERALAAGLQSVEISVSASDTHSRRNTHMPSGQALEQSLGMIRRAKRAGLHVRAGAQCALGCVYEGAVAPEIVTDILKRFGGEGADAVVVSDTTGMGSPLSVKRLLHLLQPVVDPLPVVLHLHDTRGTGLVNMMAGLECGITHFDTALGGMGGCPFIPGAAGNIATEDAAYFLATMGIETGVNVARVATCARKMERFLGRRLPGKMLRVAGDDGYVSVGHDGGGPPKR
jgi:hydroxymethylglutaryl-CoA lyase